MSVLGKIRSVAKRFGSPAKFVVKTVLGTLIPGASPVIDIIEQLMEGVNELTENDLEQFATAEDLRAWSRVR